MKLTRSAGVRTASERRWNCAWKADFLNAQHWTPNGFNSISSTHFKPVQCNKSRLKISNLPRENSILLMDRHCLKMINQRNKLFAIFTNRLSRLAFVLNSKRETGASENFGVFQSLDVSFEVGSTNGLTETNFFEFYANSPDQILSGFQRSQTSKVWKPNQWRFFTEDSPPKFF